MTDYVITAGKSASYPAVHFGSSFVGARATFCEPADFSGFDANVLAIPGLPITVLSNSPVTVADTFFGLSVQKRANDSITGIRVKTVRSHDIENGRGRWQFIQPTSNTWDFVDLDAWVNTHYAAGRDIVFTLFATPQWASARPNEDNIYSGQNPDLSYYNRGIASEPADMTKWDTYCSTIATRYLGKIKYFEIWNEPNWQNDGTGPGGTKCFFTGTWAKLSEMTRRANQAIKSIDATAKILCPPVQGWTATAGLSDAYFTGMMAASDGVSGTMAQWADIIGVHLYLPGANRTQDLAGMIDRVKASMVTAGLSGKEIWDTESAPFSPDVSGLPIRKATQTISRCMIIMASKGIARTIYYQWDNATMGIVYRNEVVMARESACELLRYGGILASYLFTDGRVAYWTASGLKII